MTLATLFLIVLSAMESQSFEIINTGYRASVGCAYTCSSHCNPILKVKYESVSGLTYYDTRYDTRSGNLMLTQPGVLVALCQKNDQWRGIDWEVNAFQSQITNGKLAVSSLTSKWAPSYPNLRPQIRVNFESSTSEITVSCSILYPTNENQNLKLVRILPNGEKLPIEINTDNLKAYLVSNNQRIRLESVHTFVNGPNMAGNVFECIAIERHTKKFASSRSSPINFEREMNKVLVIEMGYQKVLPVDDTLFLYDDFLDDTVLTCKEDMGVPRPQFSWYDSYGRRTNSHQVTINFKGPTRYCCDAKQKFSGRIVHRRQCVNLKMKPFRDCKEIKKSNSRAENGIYTIYPSGRVNSRAIRVYCDMTTANQQWIVIQRRTNGRARFDRYWNEYKRGFGQLDKEFWLGNNNIYQLTRYRTMKIRFDLWDRNNRYGYAEYSSFKIGNEGSRYRLKISGFSGYYRLNGMALNINLNGMPFSTRDKSNYNYTIGNTTTTCSQQNGNGGWWFTQHSYYTQRLNLCHRGYLNGHYYTPGTQTAAGLVWYYWTGGFESLKEVEIKVKYNH